MQHSPQEIKSRLDRAVDPEGNVLDMAAVLELVSTLERLPITREALEATRIGKTINLLRKKTNNEVLAKRAKKLVKKWQKLVINQIGANCNVDSPINGSRISSPQINGTLSETDKSLTPTLTDRKVKSISINDYKTKGVKRKRSGSSSGDSPLTLIDTSTQDSPRSLHPPNVSSDSKSLVPTNGSSSKNEFIQSKEISSSSVVHKKPKLMEDQTKLLDEKDGTSIAHTSESSTKHLTNSGNSDNDSLEKDIVTSEAQDEINIIENSENKEDRTSAPSSEIKCNVNNLDQNSDKANFSNVNDNACETDSKRDVNTGPVGGQNHCTLTQRENTNITLTGTKEEVTRVQGKNGLDIECKTNDTNSQKDPDIHNVSEKRILDTEHDMLLESHEDIEANQTSDELSPKSKTENHSKEMVSETNQETEELDDDESEPKELELDMNKEANGINGRYNDDGTWYSWTDVMPCNDGTLNILPYVILD
ncbi:mediator of RNA polymerase II transcription subunit 26-like [Actinia tenebrosa]|uniref:Mediator of RNA polymerase II transcription subunit 26 n=1 Tax=Actinia tenebrosa TaxID=6105 RepID=A0A6P8J0L2_ACTTE|nr:mediator of RNA polymerase II transcription subunit 26-like [Actinia tenebrosa]